MKENKPHDALCDHSDEGAATVVSPETGPRDGSWMGLTRLCFTHSWRVVAEGNILGGGTFVDHVCEACGAKQHDEKAPVTAEEWDRLARSRDVLEAVIIAEDQIPAMRAKVAEIMALAGSIARRDAEPSRGKPGRRARKKAKRRMEKLTRRKNRR